MRRRHHSASTYAIALMLCGCGSSAGSDATQPPPPATTSPSCVISADCPAGQHCDLSECVQDCNASDPCAEDLACSPRARCIPPGAPDKDPAPSPTFAGSLEVSPRSVLLTDRDNYFDVKLSTKSRDPVHYRVELSAPHLSIDKLRGAFSEQTTLRFRVDASALKGRDVAGNLKIFTSLGDSVVDAPIHVGVTGSYSGSLRYRAGKVTLGATHVALDVLEKSGDLAVRVDSKASLLFPPTKTGETTGHGHFTATEGLDFTVGQIVDQAFGGTRNHFRRPIGRKVRIKAKPNTRGDLEGSFDETIVGLFSVPVTISGDLLLEYQPKGRDPKFSVADDVAMPDSPAKTTRWSPVDVFGWSTPSCENVVCACDGWNCSTTCDVAASLPYVEWAHTGALSATFSQKQLEQGSASPIEPIADACKAALGVHSQAAYQTSASAQKCGLVPVLGCALSIRSQQATADVDNGRAVGRLVSQMLAPGLLVAKNEVVSALSDSFVRGSSAARQRYDAATTALGPSATWLMQPALLEYLRSMTPQAAKGDDHADPSTQSDTYPAARAISDLLYTASAIDGERARASAMGGAGSQSELGDDVQQRAVVTLLETVTLAEMVRAWGVVPDSVAARYAGVLTPLDDGFTALRKGANAFGIPSGFVPFVFRPEDAGKGATNFEQMTAIATEAIGAEKLLEQQFLGDKRTYELNNKDLQQQLTAVRTQFDTQLKTACGSKFDPAAVTQDSDWLSCGRDNAGDVGELSVEINMAKARLASAQSRIKGMKEKIKIDVNALAASQRVHTDTLNFISSTGDSLSALTMAEGIISAAEQSIQVAANAQVLNFGAPLAEAAVIGMLGVIKATIETQKVELQTAQTMRMERANAQIEMINGMANIQKETIELAQLAVDMTQDSLGVLQSTVRLRNKVEGAKSLLEERRRALAIIGKDPSNDPSYRLLRDQLGLQILKARADAQRALFLAGSALEYELNMSIGAIGGATLNARNATGLDALNACYMNIYNGSRVAFGTPQEYVTTVSVRRMLGITGPRRDDVTEQTLSEGEQFRQLLLRNQNLDGKGGVGLDFATNLQPNNGLWSTDVCADRLSGVQAQLVGDFLGDHQAQVNLSLGGGAIMRACDSDALVPWSLGSAAGGAQSAFAVVQAGVNSFGDAPANSSFFGQSVARASWRVLIPGGADAPSNADIDLTHVDDIVLRFAHRALPHRSVPLTPDVSCLAQIGGGQ